MSAGEGDALFMRLYRVLERATNPAHLPGPFRCFEVRSVGGRHPSIHLRFDGPGEPRWVGNWSHGVDEHGSLAVAFIGAGLLWLWENHSRLGQDVSMGFKHFGNPEGSGSVRPRVEGVVDGDSQRASQNGLLPCYTGESRLECVLSALEHEFGLSGGPVASTVGGG